MPTSVDYALAIVGGIGIATLVVVAIEFVRQGGLRNWRWFR